MAWQVINLVKTAARRVDVGLPIEALKRMRHLIQMLGYVYEALNYSYKLFMETKLQIATFRLVWVFKQTIRQTLG